MSEDTQSLIFVLACLAIVIACGIGTMVLARKANKRNAMISKRQDELSGRLDALERKY